MHTLLASELLEVWERGLGQPPVERALTLLAAACPEMTLDALAKLSIGERDSLLLTLREWTFGSQVVSLAPCPACGEYLELNFNIDDIRIMPRAEPLGSLSLAADSYELYFRLPNSLDLIATGRQELSTTRQLLLDRCILAARVGSEELSIAQLPEAVLDQVVVRMADADPQADVQLALACLFCRHEWQATFDIVSFFWSELNAWSSRMLQDVHSLASAYGWREADILAMSPQRRQIYLEMVRA